MSDTLGDYMKDLEKAGESRAVRGMPICARLDGRSFHTFTRGLDRPYDKRLSDMMVDTTIELVKSTGAYLGYTQSDEISLVWYVPEEGGSQYLFDGRIQKLIGILAATATGFFRDGLSEGRIPEKKGMKPVFDCRVWQVPTLRDAFLMFKWRELDAIKNSISMAAQAHFSHSQLHKIGSEEKKRWLRSIGKPWEDEPEFFRKGTYIKRVTKQIHLTPEELTHIPEGKAPEGPITRSFYERVSFPDLSKADEKVLFSEFFDLQEAV